MSYWPLILPLLIISGSCASSVSCPKEGATLKIALIDHGRHASIVLPLKGNKAVRYVYGDWYYYALSKTGILSGARALLWPTEAGLGRKSFTGPITKDNLASQLKVGIEKSFILEVNQAAIKSLNIKLDSSFSKRFDKAVYNPDYDLNFVPMDRSYYAFNNSNQKVAAWLEELGCEVRGITVFSSWRSFQ